ncbi:fanconi anemia group M protein [Trichonephila clavipes]|nr:fanconi anemia group M protein [Trichonephila clavipes]
MCPGDIVPTTPKSHHLDTDLASLYESINMSHVLSTLCCNENCTPNVFARASNQLVDKGFNYEAGKTWIYPTNYPIRDYQFTIVKEALFKNTLVILPTGLGKTFIAAVVMYNIYRWYPDGKIIFMAPTRPLVAQQIDACHKVTGISHVDTTQMTGTNLPEERKRMWMKKRVFYLTPQVLVNDLARNICPAESIKCIVVDEAHKALGNHAYCQLEGRWSSGSVLHFQATGPGSIPGLGKLKVSEELGIAQSVISRLWQRFQDDGNVSRCYSTGRPRVTTTNEDRYLVVTAKRNRWSTASDLSCQLSSATGTTVSRQTVYRCLGHIGLYACRPVRCVPLTTTHCRLRLTWSREHALWTPQQ